MSESTILSRYETSQKTRIKEARSIPGQAVNFTDQQNLFQDGWTNNQKLRQTTFTAKGLGYYDDQLENIVIPQSWNPIEDGISLNRWSPGAGYYNPGNTKS